MGYRAMGLEKCPGQYPFPLGLPAITSEPATRLLTAQNAVPACFRSLTGPGRHWEALPVAERVGLESTQYPIPARDFPGRSRGA